MEGKIDATTSGMHSTGMSTLEEIEVAVQKLSRREQELLFQQLAKRLGGGPSCYDLARDLLEQPGKIGSSGKKDLSTNKAHLTGFGKRAAKRTAR